MLKIKSAVCGVLSLALMAFSLMAMPEPADAGVYASVERTNLYVAGSSTTEKVLAVKVGSDKTDFVRIGENGLTKEIYHNEALAVAWVADTYGVEPKAIRQYGTSYSVGPDGIRGTPDDIQSEGSSW